MTSGSSEARYLRAMERLVLVVQELSLARDLDTVMKITRKAARELTGADGATFVLRDGTDAYYADEDAIAPLWKGKRFPLPSCISGWAMLNRQPAVVEDIYADDRIPHAAYRPTFVRSLVTVPIRTSDPLGAIGNYWASHHQPTDDEIRLLQALADTTAVALENVLVYSQLERRVAERTAGLEAANRELEAFTYAASHDLRAPLRHIEGYASMLAEDSGPSLDAAAREHLANINRACGRMTDLIDDLLMLSRMTQAEVERKRVDLTSLTREIADSYTRGEPHRAVELVVRDGLAADADPRLMRVVMENLLSNAFKFTSKNQSAHIEVASTPGPNGQTAYFVRDDGAGFSMASAEKLFGVFQRLHAERDFPGTGIGLATVQRIIHKHGGEIWSEAAPGRGATFYFTLSGPPPATGISAYATR